MNEMQRFIIRCDTEILVMLTDNETGEYTAIDLKNKYYAKSYSVEHAVHLLIMSIYTAPCDKFKLLEVKDSE